MATSGGNDMVSIPFKRESVSKVHFEGESNAAEIFVSIPFKRESVSKAIN